MKRVRTILGTAVALSILAGTGGAVLATGQGSVHDFWTLQDRILP